jgi:hypothetical protein
MMQTYVPDQRTAYFPVIDPSIDDPNSPAMFSGRAHQP